MFQMTAQALPYYECEVHARLSFIEPFCTDWESVRPANLKILKDYLSETWMYFNEALQADIGRGCIAANSIISIYYTLKKFTRWFAQWHFIIQESFTSIEEAIRHKARMASDVVEIIEILWIPVLDKYRPVQEELSRHKDRLTASERMELNKTTREDYVREKELRAINSLITGDSESEKDKKFDILYDVLHGIKGKTAAMYLQAAIELRWFTKMPEFSLLQRYWGVGGTQGAISKSYSTVGGSLINEEMLANVKANLTRKLIAE